MSATNFNHNIRPVFLIFSLLVPTAIYSADRYVDTQNPQASDGNPGTITRPYKTITNGVVNLAAGDHVYIRAGEYRERVNIYAYVGTPASLSFSKLIRETRAGSSSREVKYLRTGRSSRVRNGAPGGRTSCTPTIPLAGPVRPVYDQAYIRRAELAFVDGNSLKQVTSRAQMAAGTFFVDDGQQRLIVWLSDGSSPSNHRMELAVRQDGFVIGGNNYQVKGLTITHVADPYGAAAFGVSGTNVLLENNLVEWNNLDGLHIDARNATVNRNTYRYNGGVGIVGGPQSSTFDGNTTDNNSWRFGPDNHAGGVKLVGGGPSNNVFIRHRSRNNYGPGLWCDTGCQNNRFDSCQIDNNTFAGIMLENSGGNTVVNNVVSRTHSWSPLWRSSGAGILLSSVDSPAVYNNTIMNSDNYGILVYGDVRDYRPLNSRIINNIIAFNGVGGLYFGVYGSSNSSSALASHQLDYNLWYQPSGYLVSYPSGSREIETHSLAEWQAAYGQDQHSKTGNPQFSSPGAFDGVTQAGSPAVDAGVPIAGVTQDGAGTTRPKGNGVDIGAYEQAGAAAPAPAPPPVGSLPPATKYLSDLPQISATNGWGPVENDKSNGEWAAGDGHTISIRGATYPKGLGVHAFSNVVYNLATAGSCTAFISDIGVDDETFGAGAVVFQVWADGIQLYDSGVMTGTMAAKNVNTNITGRSQLTLVVNDGGDGLTSDHADWAGARLQCQ